MSRHHESARAPWGCSVAVVPVKRRIASLVTDVQPRGIELKRTRATVWTEPVGFVVHW